MSKHPDEREDVELLRDFLFMPFSFVKYVILFWWMGWTGKGVRVYYNPYGWSLLYKFGFIGDPIPYGEQTEKEREFIRKQRKEWGE